MPSLGNDLAKLRKELNLEIEDIHQSTKLPAETLRSIEDGSIFRTLDENTTYIRSYIRSYARAIRLDDALIVRALDQQSENRYNGFLDPDRGISPDDVFKPELQDDADPGQENTASDANKNASAAEENQPGSESESTGEASAETDSDEKPPVSPPPTVGSVDWADMGRKFTPLQTKSPLWKILAVSLIVIIGAGAFFAWQKFGTAATGTEMPESPTDMDTQDSLQVNLHIPTSGQVHSGITEPDMAGQDELAAEEPATSLPDTLELVIYAAHGLLEPVRVHTDVMDNLNPYWIEQGEAFTFDFVNTLSIRGQYRRMILMLNGHVVEDFLTHFYNEETRTLEINRSFFEKDPKYLQPAAGFSVDGVPPPVIKPRPTYN